MTRKFVLNTSALAICAAFMLGACGLRGDLKTPPPMWGDDERPQSETPKEPETQSDTSAG